MKQYINPHKILIPQINKIRAFLLILITCFFTQSLFAQEEPTRKELKTCYRYFGDHRIHDKWSIYTELQLRYDDLIQDWQGPIIRPAINYYWKKNIKLSVGYTYLGSYFQDKHNTKRVKKQHNIWEQVQLTQKLGRLKLAYRCRLEQRWVQKFRIGDEGVKAANGYSYANRIRYRLKATLPINQAKIAPGVVFLTLSDEVWVDNDNLISRHTFSQNWLAGSIGYQFNKQGNIQVGVLNQYIKKSDEHNYVLQIGLTYNLDFRLTD